MAAPRDPLAGSTAQLDLTYGLKFGASTTIENSLFKVTLDVSGSTADGTQVAQTDLFGHLFDETVGIAQLVCLWIALVRLTGKGPRLPSPAPPCPVRESLGKT